MSKQIFENLLFKILILAFHFFPYITNRDDALSDLGVEQVQRACEDMLAYDINPSVVKYSLAAKAMDTANKVATEMKVRSHPRSILASMLLFSK